ncbi:MAG TPA: hypothetical protein VJ982_13715, partial [Gemmatimonadota bacterium]|nr:hypothetical protein [Gemmatimonadota bacterium]
MIRYRRLASALLFASASLSSTWALPGLHAQVAVETAAVRTAPERYASAIEAGRALLDSLRLASGIPGLSVAVGIGEDVVWAEGFGFAGLENRVP